MERVELEIDADNDLSGKVNDLALHYFGDTSDASRGRVLEVAFRMRQIWARSLKEAQQETDETISNWEFPELPATKENSGSIHDWLFRR